MIKYKKYGYEWKQYILFFISVVICQKKKKECKPLGSKAHLKFKLWSSLSIINPHLKQNT
jgi:hypothetical protein